MKYLASMFLLFFAVAAANAKIVIQDPGADYIVIEAEDYEIDDRNDESGWAILDAANPEEYELHGGLGFIELPPANTNPSGGLSLLDQAPGGDFAHQVGYQMNFATAGTYYMYLRYTMFDLRELTANNYGNEDSIYIPYTSFDEDPAGDSPEIRTDRIGYSALGNQIDGVAVVPSEGCRDPEADPFDEEPLFLTDEECDAEGFRAENHWEGQYHWKPVTWNFDGEHANYEIDQTGVVLDYAIATRERGVAMDVIVFSQDSDLTSDALDALAGIGVVAGVAGDFDNSGARDVADLDLLATAMMTGDVSFDLTGDGAVDLADRVFWVESLSNTFVGDANFDGEFNSGDFVAVFTTAKYETGQPATWAEGDWNGDKEFTSGDFVAAFTGQGYEKGPRDGGLQVVPEPSSVVPFLFGVIMLGVRRRYVR